jgi:hypothetical protein
MIDEQKQQIQRLLLQSESCPGFPQFARSAVKLELPKTIHRCGSCPRTHDTRI